MNHLNNKKPRYVALLLLLSATLLRATGVIQMVEICSLCFCFEDVDNDEVTVECLGGGQSTKFFDLKSIVWPVAKDATSVPLKVRAHFGGLHLQHLPKISTRTNVVELTFKNTAISSFQNEPFEGFKNLETLTVTGNRLGVIEKDFFALKNNLKRLDLSNNSLTAVTALERSSFEQLEYIDLSHNKLKLISVHLTRALQDASTVRLEHCDLYNWESDGLPRWKWLYLSWNKLTVVGGSTFSNLQQLQALYLSHNEIQFVDPQAFSNLDQLNQLDLSYNSITNLAGNLFLPQALHMVSMAGNGVDRWPFAKIPADVQVLNIQDNKLTDVNLGQTVNILILNASNNQLDVFFGDFFPELTELDLSDNLLTDLPRNLGKQLRILILDGNPFKRVFFESRVSLKLLSLNRLPNLVEVEAYSFWKLVGVEDEKEQDCVEIQISHCPKLRIIEANAFDETDLCKLDLSYNQLTSIPENLTEWENLRGEINLQGNPWDCSCSGQWLVDDILPLIYQKEDLQYLLDDLRCAGPVSRKDARLVKYLNHRGAFCGGPQLARLVDGTQPGDLSKAGFPIIICSADDEACWHVHKGTGFIAFCVMLAVTMLVSIAMLVAIVIRRKRKTQKNTFDSDWLMKNNNYYEK
ncbi:insulin-like growth factor-binding protein complex acid labile subunit [Ochlerotatus camptorhynchus]|uniref:insulin-like growth factor-binding protein complex acid labile subunit n=1 Tax=Ochlerotatus camptorhynchus TaxID=644619 RepID=UPI0031E29740